MISKHEGAIYSDALCIEFTLDPQSMGADECRRGAALLHTMGAAALRCIAARGIHECDPHGTHESAVGAIDVLMQFANQLNAAAERFIASAGEAREADHG
jgi:hypothetical protein